MNKLYHRPMENNTRLITDITDEEASNLLGLCIVKPENELCKVWRDHESINVVVNNHKLGTDFNLTIFFDGKVCLYKDKFGRTEAAMPIPVFALVDYLHSNGIGLSPVTSHRSPLRLIRG
ncbi:MAG: hypothetical protein JWP57_4748 [Spirosoma sp.]|nr:hypothetical protein [Spirosoma sp.]